MIKSKTDYKNYLAQDKRALYIGELNLPRLLVSYISPDPIWKFQKLLRKLEYNFNCKNNGLGKYYVYYLRHRYKKQSLKLGFSIPINVFGPGLSIAHYGTIIINSATKVGANCRLHACVNIGASGGESEAPNIGDNVYIAPGAKIYGNINIANNIAIGANAVVNKSFNEESILIAGNPAKKIKEINIKKLIKHIDSAYKI